MKLESVIESAVLDRARIRCSPAHSVSFCHACLRGSQHLCGRWRCVEI